MTTNYRIWGMCAAALLLAGCDDWSFGDSNRFKEDFHYTYELKPGGRLSVENLNGSVEILAWEKNSVDITGTKYASTEQVMKSIKIDAQSSPGELRLRTIPPDGVRGNYGAKYVLRVPKRLELEKIISSNGSIRVEDIEGNGRLRTSNGSIRILRSKGNYDAVSSNGAIEVNEPSGSVTARTSNGSIKADGVRGSLEATTSNGSITAQMAEPEPGRTIRTESSNGSITLTLPACGKSDVRASTSNSSITLRLPATCAASLRAHTSNSSITSDFDVNASSRSKTSLEGTIGSQGGPLFDLRTTNGSIKLVKM